MKTLAALIAAAFAVPGLALAHAHALKTEPAKDATVPAPTAIHISFSEDVKPAFTGAAVTGPGGMAVKTGDAAFDAAKKDMTVPISGALKPGVYTVKWHAVAGDTHRSSGEFGFTVAP